VWFVRDNWGKKRRGWLSGGCLGARYRNVVGGKEYCFVSVGFLTVAVKTPRSELGQIGERQF